MERDWDAEFEAILSAPGVRVLPSVNLIDRDTGNPWSVLVSTVISLRTRDDVTLAASLRLLDRAPDPAALRQLDTGEIEQLIYPAGFYRTKSTRLLEIARILASRFGDRVPSDPEELLSLPGVGLKTANLVLGVGFGIPAICVDVHVHRIANRRGWIRTANPDESERELRRIFPERWWIQINGILVRFGQTVCTPVSPRCGTCPVGRGCPRRGVIRWR